MSAEATTTADPDSVGGCKFCETPEPHAEHEDEEQARPSTTAPTAVPPQGE